ncbi:Ubiquitin-conjugating enzyme E2 J1 [Halotydeus destructor]|nr:Ubiquitin-conjugating enzyme E2 J1 [Halotydeus destructor]
MGSQYNLRSPAVKRLMREAQELREPTEDYFAQPLEDNLFEWHFTVRGPSDSDFEGGFYHGRIVLPTEYPMKPPSIILLTPNGRFETNKKICLSISGYHPESWQPSWSIRTALLAIIGFMPTQGLGAIGSLDYPSEDRKELAIKSKTWSCPSCGKIGSLLKEKTTERNGDSSDEKEARELAKQICFKGTEALNEIPKEVPASSHDGDSQTGESTLPEASETELSSVRHRIIASTIESEEPNMTEHSLNSGAVTTPDTTLQSASSPLISTYLIILLLAAIVFLIVRRVLLL